MKMSNLSRVSAALAVVLLGGWENAASAAHELLYAITTRNNLISFYSDAPGTILDAPAINGLQGAERIRGLTMGSGILYGLGSSSRLYTIDPNTGAATQVGSGQFSTLLNGQAFGAGYGPNGVQVPSDLGQSLLINTTTGVDTVQPSPVYAAGDPHFGATPRIDAVAYIATSASWIAGDSLQNLFATWNPSTGSLNTIGNAGIDFSRFNGLSFSPTSGFLYLASPAASSDPAANLYTVNPTTGAVTLVGLLGNVGDNILVRGLTVASTGCTTPPVPSVANLPDVTGQCSASVTAPTATDCKGQTIAGTTTDPTSYSAQGDYVVHWVYTDGYGHSVGQNQAVHVHDTTLSVTCPAKMTVPATTAAGATVTFSVAASDNCDPNPTVSCSPTSGSTFPIGLTTVTCKATDGSGLTATCTFTVYVKSAAEQGSDLVAYISALPIQAGTKNSLLAKLSTLACGPLQALINEANAQSGKMLTVAQANQIIAAATGIRAVLGCP